jgi:hypothetical protein
MRWRSSRMDGKNGHLRSFGMRNSLTPACVATRLDRSRAISDPTAGALVRLRRVLGCVRQDQLCSHQADRVTQEVDTPRRERGQHLRQDRPDRALRRLLSAVSPRRTRREITRWPHLGWDPAPTAQTTLARDVLGGADSVFDVPAQSSPGQPRACCAAALRQLAEPTGVQERPQPRRTGDRPRAGAGWSGSSLALKRRRSRVAGVAHHGQVRA